MDENNPDARESPSPNAARTGWATWDDTEYRVSEREKNVRMWAMFIHLSQLANFLVPFAGIILPIVLWQVQKHEMPELEAHGKAVTNWIISELIYLAIAGILVLLIIGIPLLFALMIIGIVFPVIGALKANNGELWPYPMTITFLR